MSASGIREGPIRVLVVDDSSLFVEAITLVLEEDPELRVVGVASDGVEALRKIEALAPDIVTMDIQMPQMDGLEAVERIMGSRPTPILLLTGDPSRTGKKWHFEALRRGALDLLPKPTLMDDSEEARTAGAGLRAHLKLLAGVPVVYRRRRDQTHRGAGPARNVHHAPAPTVSGVVGIVASTGGPPVLAELLEGIPADFPLPILIVQHLAAGFAPHLVEWLGSATGLSVFLAKSGVRPMPGEVHVAPADRHLLLAAGGKLLLDGSIGPLEGHRPSGTLLLQSLAQNCGEGAIGMVLTGMGSDGAQGLKAIGNRGGLTLAQDEESSAVYGMPRAAVEEGQASRVVTRTALSTELIEAARKRLG